VKVATPLHEILENDWDAQLFRGPKSVAHALGWHTYHTLRSKGSRSGYPDRTCVRERILFAELKREKTKPTPDQVEWLDRLSRAGGECYLWRPSDLEEIAVVLGKPWLLIVGELWTPDGKSHLAPGSMWIPGAGRRDGR
jgi:hypothetical protein